MSQEKNAAEAAAAAVTGCDFENEKGGGGGNVDSLASSASSGSSRFVCIAPPGTTIESTDLVLTSLSLFLSSYVLKERERERERASRSSIVYVRSRNKVGT